MLRRIVLGCIATFALAACEPEATPLPIDIVPTTAPTSAPGAEQPIRYGIANDLLMIVSPDDLRAIAASGEIDPVSPPFLDSDLGSRYDVLVALGDLPNGTRAPTPLTISLALNTVLPPLDDDALAEIVRRAINPQALVGVLGIAGAEPLPYTSETSQALRTSLANAGLPDGFDLSLASLDVPGADAIGEQLAMIGVEVRISQIAPEEVGDLSAFHVILFSINFRVLVTELAAVDTIDLFTMPISYRAVSELTIEFTNNGLPLARR